MSGDLQTATPIAGRVSRTRRHALPDTSPERSFFSWVNCSIHSWEYVVQVARLFPLPPPRPIGTCWMYRFVWLAQRACTLVVSSCLAERRFSRKSWYGHGIHFSSPPLVSFNGRNRVTSSLPGTETPQSHPPHEELHDTRHRSPQIRRVCASPSAKHSINRQSARPQLSCGWLRDFLHAGRTRAIIAHRARIERKPQSFWKAKLCATLAYMANSAMYARPGQPTTRHAGRIRRQQNPTEGCTRRERRCTCFRERRT
jgi:hypothetical protein